MDKWVKINKIWTVCWRFLEIVGGVLTVAWLYDLFRNWVRMARALSVGETILTILCLVVLAGLIWDFTRTWRARKKRDESQDDARVERMPERRIEPPHHQPCPCVGEEEAVGHITEYLNALGRFPFTHHAAHRELAQAVLLDEEMTVCCRDSTFDLWQPVPKNKREVAVRFPEFVPPPGTPLEGRAYSELAFCRQQIEQKWPLRP